MEKDVKRGFKFALGRDLYKIVKVLIGFVILFALMLLNILLSN